MHRFHLLGSLVLASCVAFACSDDDAGSDGVKGEAGQGGSASNEAGSPSSAGSLSSGAGAPSEGGSGGTEPSPEAGAGAGGSAGEAPITAGAAGAGGEAPLEPRVLPCADEMRQDFPLNDEVSEGIVANETAGEGFLSKVDATAGGVASSPTNPWIYLRFTATGLVKVELTDEEALTSLDWDISAKRSSIRLNGGDGGPSYVSAAVLTGVSYDALTSLPAGKPLVSDDFYDDECVYDQTDYNTPVLILDSYFEAAGCSVMTRTPFVIELAGGERIKLVVEAYYGTGQENCDETGQPGTTGAQYTWRWQYL